MLVQKYYPLFYKGYNRDPFHETPLGLGFDTPEEAYAYGANFSKKFPKGLPVSNQAGPSPLYNKKFLHAVVMRYEKQEDAKDDLHQSIKKEAELRSLVSCSCEIKLPCSPIRKRIEELDEAGYAFFVSIPIHNSHQVKWIRIVKEDLIITCYRLNPSLVVNVCLVSKPNSVLHAHVISIPID